MNIKNKIKNNLLLLTISLFIPVFGFAQHSDEDFYAPKCEEIIKTPKELTFYEVYHNHDFFKVHVDVGSICKSYNHNRETNNFDRTVKYLRLEDAWQDLETGIIWQDEKAVNKNHIQAVRHCKNLGMRLPTKEEHEQSKRNGINQVFPDMAPIPHQDYGYETPSALTYWSSTLGSRGKAYAVGRGYPSQRVIQIPRNNKALQWRRKGILTGLLEGRNISLDNNYHYRHAARCVR